MRISKLLIGLVLMLGLPGCATIRGKGGVTKTTLPGVEASASQPENPKEATTQDLNSETEESYTVPAGSTIVEAPSTKIQDPKKLQISNTNEPTVVKTITVSAPMVVTKRTKHSAATKVGAAQKDDIGAQIAAVRSFRWLQILGAVVFLAGVLAAVWPPAKAIVGGSLTTAAAIAGAGVFLIFFPPFFVGHEVLVFVVCMGGAGVWFLAHRHGSVQGELKTLKAAAAKVL